jgi:type II secretory pathway predicted ATPase ExeA
VFLDFYQMREQPFGVTPDPRFLYFGSGHREALASLFYGIETGRGFLSLIAEPGMGKTTILFQLLQRWKGYVHSAFLFQTQCSSRELIRYLLHDLGLNCEGEDVVRMHSELNQFLFREALAGRRVVVFIDEAQNLADGVLETVRLLSDFEATDKKLLQIVLAGQPELALRLARPGMAQLRQRIAVQARLDALPASEILPYINHRLQVVGYSGTDLFTPGAIAAIAARSRGIPRLINHLCFSALTIGCALARRQINSEIIREAAVDLSLETRPVSLQPRSSQAPRQLTPANPSKFKSLRSWIRRTLYKRHVYQTSVLFLLLGSSVFYFAARPKSQPAQTSAATSSASVHASEARPSASPVTRADPTNHSQLQPPGLPQVSQAASVPKYFTYVIQPNDTLRDICVSGLGKYDSAVLSEVQSLNANLKDPDHLAVGETIRLPVDVPASAQLAPPGN